MPSRVQIIDTSNNDNRIKNFLNTITNFFFYVDSKSLTRYYMAINIILYRAIKVILS